MDPVNEFSLIRTTLEIKTLQTSLTKSQLPLETQQEENSEMSYNSSREFTFSDVSYSFAERQVTENGTGQETVQSTTPIDETENEQLASSDETREPTRRADEESAEVEMLNSTSENQDLNLEDTQKSPSIDETRTGTMEAEDSSTGVEMLNGTSKNRHLSVRDTRSSIAEIQNRTTEAEALSTVGAMRNGRSRKRDMSLEDTQTFPSKRKTRRGTTEVEDLCAAVETRGISENRGSSSGETRNTARGADDLPDVVEMINSTLENRDLHSECIGTRDTTREAELAQLWRQLHDSYRQEAFALWAVGWYDG